jgi:hypothetical protein
MIKLHARTGSKQYAAVVRWRPDVKPLSPFPNASSAVWNSIDPDVMYVPSLFQAQGGAYGGFARDVYAVHHPSLLSVASAVADTMWECIPLADVLAACGDGLHVGAVTWCECVYTVHLHRYGVGVTPWPEFVESFEGYRAGEWLKVEASSWQPWRQRDGKWYRV